MSKEKHIETPFGFNLPCKVFIGAVPYLVRDDPTMDDMGECNVETKIIRINVKKHHTGHQLLLTWHHETGHGICEEYGERDNEKSCDRRAQGRTQVHAAWIEAQ
jgi:hypothetical protein